MKILEKELNFMTTGIGSVALTDTKEALDIIFECVDIPFWPQLPNLSKNESMVLQFCENIPCLKIMDKDLVFMGENCEQDLERCYEHIIAEDRDFFKVSKEYAEGFYAFLDYLKNKKTDFSYIKGHITGPFSFAASVKTQGNSLVSDNIMMEVITKALAWKSLWQIAKLKQANKKVIFFIDEPYLSCLGSGFAPINKDSVKLYLSEFIKVLRKEEVLVGLHCCGNTDWGLLMDLDIDVINFDAFGFVDKFILFSEEIKRFLLKGKVLAWGIVPTSEYNETLTSKDLYDKLKVCIERLEKKGIERTLIINNSLITPSCGLGSIKKDVNPNIFRLLKQTADLLRQD